MLKKGRQIRKSSGKFGCILAAEPAQLSDILIEQIHGILEMHSVFAFCKQRKPETYSIISINRFLINKGETK